MVEHCQMEKNIIIKSKIVGTCFHSYCFLVVNSVQHPPVSFVKLINAITHIKCFLNVFECHDSINRRHLVNIPYLDDVFHAEQLLTVVENFTMNLKI